MRNQELNQARKFDGYIQKRFSKRKLELQTISTNAVDELWALLEYHSEVNDSLDALVEKHKKRDREAIKRQFQAFIRQAKTYYYTAQPLHYRSSGLLYYYAFLNLAKAALILWKPEVIVKNTKIKHGLTYKNMDRPFESERIKVIDGVFPFFYEMQTGTVIKNEMELKIVDLLAYCGFIGGEYQRCGYGELKIIPCKACILADRKQDIGWALLGIYKIADYQNSKHLLKALRSYFEEVRVTYPYAAECFKLNAQQHEHYDFWQSKKPMKIAASGRFISETEIINTMNALSPYATADMYSVEEEFALNMPWRKTKPMVMTELLGSYAVTFYVSSLVRYQPQILESLLGSKQAWLLSSFIRQCGSVFLRQITAEILDRDYVFLNK